MSPVAGAIRAGLVCALVTAAVYGGIALLTVTADGRSPAVPAPAPDMRIVWTPHTVEGMMLLDPAQPDSLGNPRCLVLPPGSVLLVPKAIRGFDLKREKS